jgi:hypothetical protein
MTLQRTGRMFSFFIGRSKSSAINSDLYKRVATRATGARWRNTDDNNTLMVNNEWTDSLCMHNSNTRNHNVTVSVADGGGI